MAATGQSVGPFGAKLRAELDRQGIGVRTLARRMAASDETRAIENLRRQLNKYLGGVTPQSAKRHAIEAHLGLERDALAEEEEDEEAATTLRAFTALFSDLVERMVEAKLAQREGARA